MQNIGISTHLRDCSDQFLERWEDATEDGVIDRSEIVDLTPLIKRKAGLIIIQDDAIRLSLTLMKVGDGSRDTKQRLREHERLYGPIELDPYHNEKRRHCGNSDDAA